MNISRCGRADSVMDSHHRSRVLDPVGTVLINDYHHNSTVLITTITVSSLAFAGVCGRGAFLGRVSPNG